MDFHQLNIFAAVYQLKSFTGASKKLGISQPTISEHIKNLEADLSCRLFDRLGRTIIPTPAADLLFPRARQLLETAIDIRNDLAESAKNMAGEITIGSSTIPGTYLMPSLAVAFKNEFPEVTFEIIIKDSNTINEMVLAHDLYCGIVGARHESEQLEFTQFVSDELVLVTSNKLALKEEINLNELAELPFLSREKGSGTKRCLEGHLQAAGISPGSLRPVATLATTAAVKEAVRQGLGVTILSRLAVENELAEKALRLVKIRDLVMTRDFYLVQHKLRTLPERYRAFIHHLQSHRPK